MRRIFSAAASLSLAAGCADWSTVEPADIARLTASAAEEVHEAGIDVPTWLQADVENTGVEAVGLELVGAAHLRSDGTLITDDIAVEWAVVPETVRAHGKFAIAVFATPQVADLGGQIAVQLAANGPAWPTELELLWTVDVLADFDGDGADHPDAGGDDCDDQDASIGPSSTEIWYDGIDQDCDGNDTDADGDGFAQDDDCDDTDPTARPDGTEIWYDGIDQDCDGNDTDADEDGFDAVEVGGPDCNDSDADIRPGVADGGLPLIDDDCDGLTDEEDAIEGMVVLTELHREPSDGPGAVWFELVSRHTTDLMPAGWRVRTDLAEGTLVVPVDSPALAPNGVWVVCADPAAVPDVPCAATIEPWPDPVVGADALSIYVDAQLIDAVRWNAAWPGGLGVAMSLDPRAASSSENDAQVAWCAAQTAWADADLGTPGLLNPRCD